MSKLLSRVKRSIWNTVASVSNLAVTACVGLIATPLLIDWLGEERYGAYRLVTDYVGYLALLDLGFFGALIAIFASCLGKANREGLQNSLAAGIRIYVFVTFASILLGAGMYYFIDDLISVRQESAADLKLAWIIAVLPTLFLPLSPLRALLDARQMSYRVIGALILQSLIVTAFSLYLAYNGWGITGQFVAIFIGATVYYAVIAYSSFGVEKSITLSTFFRKPPRSATDEVWQLNRPVLILNACGRINLLSDNIFIGLIMGPLYVVPFFVTQRFIQLCGSGVGSIGNSTWAALAELYIQGKTDDFKARIYDLTKMISTVGIAILAPAVVFNSGFVGLWVGADRFGGEMLTYSSGCSVYILTVGGLWGWCFTSTGKLKELIPLALTQSIINLSFSIGLTFAVGLPGPTLGTLISLIVGTVFWYPLLMRTTYGISVGKIYSSWFLPVLSALPLILGCVAWETVWPISSWLDLAVRLAFASMSIFLSGWLTAFSRNERAQWSGWLLSLLKRSAPKSSP